MSGDGGRFLEACGATGPLELAWEDRETGETARRGFDRPAVLVGRNPRGDLVLDHPGVSKRHAYLQVIEGRLHAIDLESRDGLRWSGVPRRSGWVDRGRPMELGPMTVRVVGGDRPEGPGIGPGPLSRRYAPRQPLPEVALEIRDAGGEPTRVAMDRVLVLVGGSPLCKVPLPGPESSRFACALVRTPAGVWMVDLLSSRGVAVNGVACRDAWLDDGDVVRAGARSLRLTYRSPATAARPLAEAGPLLPAPVGPLAWPGRPAPEAGDPAWELIPEMILRQLPDGHGATPEASSAPFNQALLMLIRLLGEMHRDHLEVVRDEMEQIRRLNQEMSSLRAQLPRPDPAVGAGPAPAPGPVPNPEEGDPGPPPEDLAPGRPDPRAVQAIVGRRLAAWEKERQGRWRKVMDLLVKP